MATTILPPDQIPTQFRQGCDLPFGVAGRVFVGVFLGAFAGIPMLIAFKNGWLGLIGWVAAAVLLSFLFGKIRGQCNARDLFLTEYEDVLREDSGVTQDAAIDIATRRTNVELASRQAARRLNNRRGGMGTAISVNLS